MSAPASLSCPLCQKRYTRLDHLQRHLSAHAPGRPFVCEACGKGFKRKDILSRHESMCRYRTLPHQDTPCGKPLRTTRKACDRCAKQKRACSSGQPCESCKAKNKLCLYTWLDALDPRRSANVPDIGPLDALEHFGRSTAIATAREHEESYAYRISNESWDFPDERKLKYTRHPGTSSVHLADSTIGRCPSTRSNSSESLTSGNSMAGSFNFLLRFTSNSNIGLTQTFSIDKQMAAQDCSNLETSAYSATDRYSGVDRPDRGQQHQTFDSDAEVQHLSPRGTWFAEGLPDFETFDILPYMAQAASPFQMIWPSSFAAVGDHRNNYAKGMLNTSESAMSSSGSNGAIDYGLIIKSQEIFCAIRQFTSTQPARVVTSIGPWSTFLEELCTSFFAPANLDRFLQLYWTFWYPNTPFIHKPTFTAARASYALVASMALLGACLSPLPADRESAKFWFDPVEELVFNDESTYNLMKAAELSDGDRALRPMIQAIQASYAICVLQTWEGQDVAATRIRRQRHGMVVSAARQLMCYANQSALDVLTSHTFDWHEFTTREELTRTLLYVFLLDTAFIIFNNTPPRMVIRELCLDLACPEPCFQAESAELCLELLQKWISHRPTKRRMSLFAAISALRREKMDVSIQEDLAQSGVLNLWAITSAFHVLLFHIEPGFSTGPQLVVLRNAILNWRTIWDSRFADGFVDACGIIKAKQEAPQATEQSWKRIGFMRNAPEYWRLAQLILERLESTEHSLEAAEELCGLGSGRWSTPLSVLPKFDETDMGQLHEFIATFQELKMDD